MEGRLECLAYMTFLVCEILNQKKYVVFQVLMNTKKLFCVFWDLDFWESARMPENIGFFWVLTCLLLTQKSV